MGLDDFISDDNSSSSSSKSSSSSSSTPTHSIGGDIGDSELTFYGSGDNDLSTTPMERENVMSDYNLSELINLKDGELEYDRDHIKLYCPVFYTITGNPKFESGDYIQLKYTDEQPRPSWHNRIVSCVLTKPTRLGDIQKETIMLATGEYEKDKIMDKVESDISNGSGDVTADTNVYISVFVNVFMARDLAQAGKQFKSGSLINRDKIMSQVLSANTLASRVNNE